MEMLIVAILLGLIPAFIAKLRGRSFGRGGYRAAFIIVAPPHAIITKADQKALEQEQPAEA